VLFQTQALPFFPVNLGCYGDCTRRNSLFRRESAAPEVNGRPRQFAYNAAAE